MEVYLVIFHTGEWDSYRQEIIKIFKEKEHAEDYASQLRTRLDSIGRHKEGNNSVSENKNTKYNEAYLFALYYQEKYIIAPNGAWITVSNPYPVYEAHYLLHKEHFKLNEE